MKQILVRLDRCVGCKTCELQCSIKHSRAKDLFGAVLGGERPVRRVFVETNGEVNMPLQCRQCREPRCVQACMSGAMYEDRESGLVLNREERCLGCWMCVMACPFGAIVPDEREEKAVKCDQCLSEDHDPACVRGCPTGALQFVEIAEFDKKVRGEFLTEIITGKGVEK